MKKVLILVIALLISASIFLSVRPATITAKLRLPEENTKEVLYQDIFVTLLMPEINKAISDFYGKYLKELPGEDTRSVKVLGIERPNGYRTTLFIIKLQVLPYLGPHNSVGRDNITIRVAYGEKPQIVKFEHLESYLIPSYYQNVIKTKWPPE